MSQTLSDYDDLGDETDKTHYWFGGRGGFVLGDLSVRGEYTNGQDGLLPRDGYYGELSYRFDVSGFLPIESLRPLVRYGELNVRKIVPRLGETESWDRQLTTIALIADLNKNIYMRIEYYFIDEVTGGAPPEDKVADDCLLVQLDFSF